MKPKVAFFDLTSCEGCQLQVLECEEHLLEVVDLVEIVNSREAISEHRDDYEIAFVEGSITTPQDVEQVRQIRQRAKLLIALGACACTGGLNTLKNQFDLQEIRNYVYGELGERFETMPAQAVHGVVSVDGCVPGCPIDRNEFVQTLQALLMDKRLTLPDYPVCVECRLRESECVLAKGQPCLGPLTRAGCQALCPAFGAACEGCRGLLPGAPVWKHCELLRESGMKPAEILNQYRRFLNLWQLPEAPARAAA